MPDQTAFPSILVNHIRIKQGTGGVTNTFEIPERGTEFAPDKVTDFVERSDRRGFIDVGSDYTIQYNLTVRSQLARSAKMKARLFTRVKNPFESGGVEIVKVEESDDLENMKSYRVVTQISK